MDEKKDEEECYFCKKPFEKEQRSQFAALIGGLLRKCHKSCYHRATRDKTNIRFKVR